MIKLTIITIQLPQRPRFKKDHGKRIESDF